MFESGLKPSLRFDRVKTHLKLSFSDVNFETLADKRPPLNIDWDKAINSISTELNWTELGLQLISSELSSVNSECQLMAHAEHKIVNPFCTMMVTSSQCK